MRVTIRGMLKNWFIAFFILATGLFVLGWQNAVYSNPGDTFEIYRQALAGADIETYMSCITQDSKDMLSQRPPQAATMLREYRDIAGKDYKVEVEGSTAMLEFQPASEFAPPYLLKMEKGGWKIDLKRMSEEISFDQGNHWHWKD